MQQNPQQQITQQYVQSLTQSTKNFLCPLEANVYGIQFTAFKIRDYQTNDILVQVNKRPEDIGKPLSQSSRKVKYNFGPYFFLLKIIGTTLKFKVGPKPVKNFTMIQRHYFKNKLIKSYKFQAPFCMPNSTNQMQAIYQLPQLSEEQIEDMITSPWETVSDSFYFVQGKLIMHTKAQFSYTHQSSQ